MLQKIKLSNISKRYGYSWIIKGIDLELQVGDIVGIRGLNGSGKSTLMKILSSYLPPTEGSIIFLDGQDGLISHDDIFNHINFVAPYTDPILEMTAEEYFKFHSKFKKWRDPNMDYESFKSSLGLQNIEGKEIKDYSSGMGQRIQLAIGVLSDSVLLLLDEPTAFLDEQAADWFYQLLKQNCENRIVVIASNDVHDFGLCHKIMNITELQAN